MHTRLRHRYALAGFGLLAFVTFLAGCGQPVREDRSINWSKEGESVGFQHGQEGIFLAPKDGGKLTKIFQPDSGMIATSTPLWSPTGKRVLFTTARSPSGQPPVNLSFMGGEQDPAGKIHLQQDIVYTCWLYEQTDGGKPAEPVALFGATTDHPGYVAANLAVRWHPRLERIYYVRQVAAHQHGLFEYDLASKRSRQVFPHTSEALIFDWTPDGSHLVCVLGSTHKGGTDGIWIGQPTQADWWQVPHSGELAPGEFGSLLENLRSTRPAWTRDGSRFAFPSYVPGPTPQNPGCHFLRQATLATRAVDVWAEGDQPFRDLRWDKAGLRLGVVRGGESGSLHLVRQGQPLSPAVNRVPVRRFAGWSANGERLAYVAPDGLPLASDEPWALLLIADASARDKVHVAAGEGTEPGQPVFSGMRVTFPQWSPHVDKLSLWVTFMPACRSVVSHLLGWGLRPGDPAAVFDLKTGQLGWLPVNATEKVQIGHYYLLKRDYAQAWRWYQEAERELPQAAPVVVREFMDYLRALQGPRDFSFFQYHCLAKLGRAEEARAKLDQFPRLFLPRFVDAANGRGPPATVTVDGKTLERHLQDLVAPSTLIGSLLQDMYVAEVFLSLDASQDGEAFFRTALGQADTDAARLSRAITLGQILLLERKYREYADLATEAIAPLLTAVLKPVPAGGQRDFLDSTTLAEFAGELALLPLGASEFLSRLPGQQLQEMRSRWEKLQAKANDRSRPLLDLVLHGLYQALGREQKRQEAAARLKNPPAESVVLPADGELGKAIVALHTQMRDLLRRRY
jgi:Tol biopolymer transport system component